MVGFSASPLCDDVLLIILVYAEYAKTSNLFAVAIYLIMLVGGQTAQFGKRPGIPRILSFASTTHSRLDRDADPLQGATCGSNDGPESMALKA
jgi:hypothetical protein